MVFCAKVSNAGKITPRLYLSHPGMFWRGHFLNCSMALKILHFLLPAAISFAGVPDEAVRQPDVILVQLSSEQNRMKKLNAENKPRTVEKLRREAGAMNRAIRNDLRDHFSFCPVYYFMDTNLARLEEGQLSGILMDADGAVADARTLTGKNYQIAYYGYPHVHIPRIGRLPDSLAGTGFDADFGKVWVLLDERGHQVAYTAVPKVLEKGRAYFRNKDYHFVSKEFDMEYRPVAYKLQEAMYEMAPK